VLMASIKIPPAWAWLGTVRLSISSDATITQALQIRRSYYRTVYGYDWNDTTDPWKVYDVSVPTWVNDLRTLEFGQVYWISMTQADHTLSEGDGTRWMASSSNSQWPPATYLRTSVR